ncbi:MAG: 5-(carboxyamino)imidazole ribonucleotide mutase [Gammaproteobacteria bacterium]
MNDTNPQVAILMGSKNDWPVMRRSAEVLRDFGVPWQARALSAHRAPELLGEYIKGFGGRLIIAGAGGAAHLPGVIASQTTLPVLGVPIAATPLNGADALHAIVQMPRGIPVATFAIGEAGAANAALFAVAIWAMGYKDINQKLSDYRKKMADDIKQMPPLELD